MKGRFLLASNKLSFMGRNVFADKSALVLEWILLQKKASFSIREVAQDTKVGVGTVHRVFEYLILKGYLKSEGIRTKKTFSPLNLSALLNEWINEYNILEKCKLYPYSSSLDKNQILAILKQSNIKDQIALALHSSAEALGLKHTNLQQIELYLINPEIRSQMETLLKLTPKERGYDVLLIEPYYKSILKKSVLIANGIGCSPPLLTFLDLYHFPLRGLEQAEHIAQKLPELKHLYKRARK